MNAVRLSLQYLCPKNDKTFVLGNNTCLAVDWEYLIETLNVLVQHPNCHETALSMLRFVRDLAGGFVDLKDITNALAIAVPLFSYYLLGESFSFKPLSLDLDCFNEGNRNGNENVKGSTTRVSIETTFPFCFSNSFSQQVLVVIISSD